MEIQACLVSGGVVMRLNKTFSCLKLRDVIAAGLLMIAGAARPAQGAPLNVTFTQSAETVEAYDFVEVTLNVASPDAKNPFTDVVVEGQFGKAGETKRLHVDGFCDSP
ncbi:MAG TPA: DUF5060 domain-containing protein, partial [Terriglobia bacterium]|nr:DUF5060 domain-containing protein [Terriglobia bacterium]